MCLSCPSKCSWPLIRCLLPFCEAPVRFLPPPPCMLPPSQLIQVKILCSKSRVGLLKERIITTSYWYMWCISCCSHLKSDFYGTKSNPRLISIVSKPIGFVFWPKKVLIKKIYFDIESLGLFGDFRRRKMHLFGILRPLKHYWTFWGMSGALNWWFLAF